MAALLVLLAVAILLLVVVWAVRRRSDDEVHSVEGYRHALTTLEEVRTRTGGSVRPIRPSSGQAGDQPKEEDAADRRNPTSGGGHNGWSGSAITSAPGMGGLPPPPTPRRIPEPLTAADLGIEAGDHLVFGDPRADAPDPVPLVVDTGTEEETRGRVGRHRRDHRGAPQRPRSSRGVVWASAAAVVVVVAGVGAYAATRSHPGQRAIQASGRPGAARSVTSVPKSTTPTKSTKSTKSTTPKASRGKRTTPTTTTTTVPSVLTPLSPTSTDATYTVPAGAYAVTMSVTTGPCWMQVTSASTGQTLFAGTIQPGQQQRVQTTGATSILIGAVSASIRVNGTPASLPSGLRTPFTLNLQPS